eukprot:TRINITY_DN3750_c0_g1_i8.p1 TRINITY_DN3750_c0_g1~~TRINITY_DN3750_c0_g1_i8.p1  ORF type:complete len:181 (+),score=38.19 TRINITY_DN3750_c0_g1_i8:379-921(+)
MESFASHHGRPVPDALADEVRSGTQAHVLWKRLDVMPDDCWVHPLAEPLTPAELSSFGDFLRQIHAEAQEYDYKQAYPVTLGLNDECAGATSKFFCSELVAASLKAAGRLAGDLNASLVVPGDFSQEEFAPGVLGERWRLVQAGHPSLERLISDTRKDAEIEMLRAQVKELKHEIELLRE